MQIVTGWMEEGIEKGPLEGWQGSLQELEELGEALLAFESADELAAWLGDSKDKP